jgi:Ras family protein A
MCISLWDASYGPDPHFLRSLRYHNVDGSIICFSIGEPDSLGNVRERWMPELTHFMAPKSPVLLVGCKSDLRDDLTTVENLRQRGESPVTQAQGLAMAGFIKARIYLECSALTGEGVREVFLHAMEAATRCKIAKPTRRRSGCVIA